jgi:peptide chain release factor 1
MLEKIATIEERYDELERLISDPAMMNDYTKIAEYSKERAGLAEIVENYRDYKRQLQELDDARKMLDEESDPELSAMAQEAKIRVTIKT